MPQKPARYLVAIAATAIVGMASFITYETMTGYRQQRDQAARDTARLVRALEEHTFATLNAVDATLLALGDRLAPEGSALSPSAAIHLLLAREAQRLPQIRTLVLLDAAGAVTADSQHARPPTISLADREYFTAHLQAASTGLIISRVYESRISKEPFFAMSRSLRDASGGLTGVIAAFVEPRHFEAFYKSLNLGKDGVVSLLREDGILLAREPARPHQLHVSYADAPLFQEHLPKSSAGTYESVYRDGQTRISSYRAMTSLPLLVSIAVATDDVLAGWYQLAHEYLTIWLIFAAGLVGATAILAMTLSRNEQLQRRAHELQRQFQTVAENSPGIVYRREMTADGQVTYPLLSSGVREIFGIGAADAMANPRLLLDSIHPDDRVLFERSLHDSAKTLSTWSLDFRIIARDGVTRWIRGRSYPSRGADGATIWDGAVTDITDQKLAEERVVRAEQRLRDAIASLSDGFILWDAEDRLVMCNDATHRNAAAKSISFKPGETFAEIMRRSVGTGALPEAVGREEEYMAARLHRHKNPTGEPIEQRFSDGRWVRLNEYRTREGGVVSLRRDISLEKRLIAELTHAKETAERANRAKADFLANMSHELRTPLNSIIGFSDLMAQQILGPLGDPRYLGYCADIQDSGQHLLSLINDILDYSKVEAGQMTLDAEDLELSTILETCMRMVAERARRAEVAFSSTIEPGLGTIHADQRKLKQILLNLFTNAIKYNRRGGTVRVMAKRRDGAVAIIVADTGIGIPADNIAAVMEPFRQVVNAYNRTQDGTGLGLPLTKRLVEMHSGALTLESELGVGTTVTISLPRHRRASDAATAASDISAAATPA